MYCVFNRISFLCLLIGSMQYALAIEENRTDTVMSVLDNQVTPGKTYRTYYMPDICHNGKASITVNTTGVYSAGVLQLVIYPKNTPQFNCLVTLTTKYPFKILVHLHSYKIGISSLKKDCLSYLEISGKYGKLRKVCSEDSDKSMENEFYDSVENSMKIFYNKERGFRTRDTLSLTFTAFQPYKSSCGERFRCKNYRCISKALICDGRNNCGDWSDESYPFPCTKEDKKEEEDNSYRFPPGGIAIIAASVIMVVFFLYFVLPYSKKTYLSRIRRRRQNQQTQQTVYTIDGDQRNNSINETQNDISKSAADNAVYVEDDPPLYEDVIKLPVPIMER